MSVYAVGDIQGCYRELMELLDRVGFNPKTDKLWVAGDIVNRGPNSKAALKFLYDNRKSVINVLGNHDLHLLAIYYGVRNTKASDTLRPILNAKACDDWMQWLRHSPLFYRDKKLDYSMAHAGIAPQWSLKQAARYSGEVETALKSRSIKKFLTAMYGNEPACWNEHLNDLERLRCITNYFTRMRVVDRYGGLQFSYTGDTTHIPDGYHPWFKHPKRKTAVDRIIFGHWAALGGYIDAFNFGLDTGCVWGRYLTLMNLETQELHIAKANTITSPKTRGGKT